MKLKVKLKKLSLKKPIFKRYFITIDNRPELLDKSLNIKNITFNDDKYSFYCNKKSMFYFKELKDLGNKIEIIDRFMFFIKNNYLKKIFILLCFLFVFSFFFINKIYISGVSFIDKKDDRVYKYVIDNLEKRWIFYKCEKPLEELSFELRTKFCEYAYVGLSKKGSVLMIDIVSHGYKIEPIKEDVFGEYYSTNNAIIEHVDLRSGLSLIKKGDVVKTNQIVATSNLKFDEQLYSKDYLVPLSGLIIGRFIEYVEVKIYKEELVKIPSNKSYQIVEYNVFGHDLLPKKIKYNEYKKYQDNIFKIGNILLINKTTYYEINDEIIKNDLIDAIVQAKNKITSDFYKNRVSEKENIINIVLLEQKEEFDYYRLKFAVNQKKNIIKFYSY